MVKELGLDSYPADQNLFSVFGLFSTLNKTSSVL